MGPRKAEFLAYAGQHQKAWRLHSIPPRPDSSYERAVVIAGLAEIIRLRLCAAYVPLLRGLQRIEDRVSVLTVLREDPYAPPPKRQGAPVQIRV